MFHYLNQKIHFKSANTMLIQFLETKQLGRYQVKIPKIAKNFIFSEILLKIWTEIQQSIFRQKNSAGKNIHQNNKLIS